MPRALGHCLTEMQRGMYLHPTYAVTPERVSRVLAAPGNACRDPSMFQMQLERCAKL